LEIVQWCIEQRLRIGGFYSPTRVSVEHGLRVAGQTPSEVNQAMLGRVQELIRQRRELDDALSGRN
jgi:hypothetical protein